MTKDKNKNRDEKLLEEATGSHEDMRDPAFGELLYRLKKSIDKFNCTSTVFSIIIAILTFLMLVGLVIQICLALK